MVNIKVSRLFGMCFFVLFFLCGNACAMVGLPVFPGAEGFGVTTPAGRFGKVFKINNTDASGPGSLAECLEAEGARICVFEKGGTITLEKDIVIKNPYLTIAGQTAPLPGITIKGAGLRIATHDVLVQHIRIRHGEALLGNGRGGDSLGIYGKSHKSANTSNIVIDHCSLSWAVDENISLWSEGVHDVTISNCIISEGLYDSFNPSGKHSCGMLVGYDIKNVSIHSNLFAHNNNRNPNISGNSDTIIANNLIYNPQYAALQIKDTENAGLIRSIIQNNVVKYGPNSIGKIPIGRIGNVSNSTLFYKDNVILGKDRNDNYLEISGSNVEFVDSYPIEMALTTIHDVDTLEKHILDNVGAMPRYRDDVDKRIIADVAAGTGHLINCVGPETSVVYPGRDVDCSLNAGGWPQEVTGERAITIDSILMPDKDDDKDGYSNFEEWLHDMKKNVEKRSFSTLDFYMMINRGNE